TSNELLIVNDWKRDMENIGEYLSEIGTIPLLEGNAPSERVASSLAPQRIEVSANQSRSTATEQPSAQVVVRAAPVHNQVNTQEATQVHIPSEPSRPRFKLGMRAPTVSPADSTHQISEEQATRVASNLNNPVVRPVAPAAPTPPVGAYLQQQQPM